MPLMDPTNVLQWNQEGIFRADRLPLVLNSINASHPSALFPFQNLRNKYYGLLQSRHIGRLTPAVGFSMVATFQHGWGASYQMRDEAQRQLAQGIHLQNGDNSFYRLARQ